METTHRAAGRRGQTERGKVKKWWFRRSPVMILLWLLLLAAGCRTMETETLTPPPPVAALPAIDYADRGNWVLLPDPAAAPHEVDVFYVYPTVVADREQPLMDWSDPAVRAKTVRIAGQQAGCFSGFANLYAPFCRQLEFYRAIADLRRDPWDYSDMAAGVADLRAAFRYYLKHYNRGRPFILLGHSQGAMALLELMKSEFGTEPAARRLVAAYLIGIPLRPAELSRWPHLKFAQSDRDTGVIVSYNSVAPGTGRTVFTAPGVYCINPLTWRTDAAAAPAALSRGAVFFDDAGAVSQRVPHFCSTRINPEFGALEVTPAQPGGGPYDAPELLGEGVYHMNDIYFFYEDLKANAELRSKHFRQR